ncbi:MAG: CBS domain-containing protein [Deltaproteobacteria bacterium]|nr:CBS domain-containing protein [Deltaproteobacteria bacterium]
MKDLFAKDVMNRGVLAVKPHWSTDQLADFLVQNAISGAPVVLEDGKLVGVVSLTDLVRQEYSAISHPDQGSSPEYYPNPLELKHTHDEFRSYGLRGDSQITVRDIMTPVIFSVPENATLHHVADSMIRGRIHRVFVTHQDRLVGIITALDMLKVVRDL